MTTTSAEREFHRTVAQECFNRAWTYLERRHRRADEDREMLHLGHAARYHWSRAGTPTHVAISDWQVSRIYAALDDGPMALEFARSSLELCRRHRLAEYLPSAHEAMARAYAVARDVRAARPHIERARALLTSEEIDAEDREIYRGQIAETERWIDRIRSG
jgi:hypothetical protein